MDLNKVIERAKAILLTPKTEWPVIAGEPATAGSLYKNYILILAAIPVVCQFLKQSLIGVSLPFIGTVRIGILAGISQMLFVYVLTLAMLFVVALIIDALAPTFGGQKDQTQALKTITYAYTASWVAGVAYILPWIGWLIVFAGGIYGIYLLYLGLPHTMKCPPDKAVGYTVVVIIATFVLSIAIGMVAASVTGVGAMMSGMSAQHDDVQFDEDSPLGKLEEWGKQVEQAGKQMEEAQKSGDQEAQADAMKALMGAALGGGNVEALEPERLKAFVPDTLGGLSRSDMTVERNGAMGMQVSEARATYSDTDGRSLQLQITDTGSAKGLLALAGWVGVEGESQTDNGYEKTYREDGRIIHEQWDGSSGEYTIVLADRFTVEVSGSADGIEDLKEALDGVDLSALEDLKDEGVKEN